MAEHVSSFSVDLSELDKRKVVLNMTFTYQDKSYDISETIKLRNDLSSEPSSIYSWISGIRIIPRAHRSETGTGFRLRLRDHRRRGSHCSGRDLGRKLSGWQRM